jgi:peptide/nickel transport system substrate-binding protein
VNKTTIRRAAAFMTVMAVLLAACGKSSKSTNSSGTAKAGDLSVVHLAYNADMQVPDPDIFYEIEGNSVTTSVYEGLVRYKPNSTEVEPALAESFTTAPDGLTYTFKLRPGVKFHDGTAMDSAAIKGSFERRTAVNSAPAYMLADVASYETPDASTFIVHLKQPVSAFLDYLAAPYGPKGVSPKVLADHGGTDHGQDWLKTHDAGTGPFTISDFQLGTTYTLTRNDAYWAGKPEVSQIVISIIPDISTQRLKLESGELSMIIHGLSAADITALGSKSGLQVQRFPSLFKAWIMTNPNKGVFKDQALRTALRYAVDKAQMAKDVYGENGVASTQYYPVGELPAGQATDSVTLDPSKLATAVKGLSSKKVDIGFSSDDPRNGRLAEILQTELQAAGLDATSRGIPIAQVFDLPNHKDTAPDLLVSTVNPDAAHPDTWARIFSNTAGALNWEQCSVPAADAAMDAGLHATDPVAIKASYAKAGDALVASGCYIGLADVKEVIVAKKGYTNFVHQMPTLFTIRFGDLKVS